MEILKSLNAFLNRPIRLVQSSVIRALVTSLALPEVQDNSVLSWLDKTSVFAWLEKTRANLRNFLLAYQESHTKLCEQIMDAIVRFGCQEIQASFLHLMLRHSNPIMHWEETCAEMMRGGFDLAAFLGTCHKMPGYTRYSQLGDLRCSVSLRNSDQSHIATLLPSESGYVLLIRHATASHHDVMFPWILQSLYSLRSYRNERKLTLVCVTLLYCGVSLHTVLWNAIKKWLPDLDLGHYDNKRLYCTPSANRVTLNPLSLRLTDLARVAIRNSCYGPNLQWCLNTLEYPKKLKDFLLMADFSEKVNHV